MAIGLGAFPPAAHAEGQRQAGEFAAATACARSGRHESGRDGDAHEPPVPAVLRRYGIDAERASAMPVDGTPERAAERIVEFARVGVARLVLGFPDADWRTRYELAAQAARAVRVHRAWVHEVDANERVFREAGRQAVTEAPAAGRTGVAERAGGQR